jgi:hypothetical protein
MIDTKYITITGGCYYDWGLTLDDSKFIIPITGPTGIKSTDKELHRYVKRFLKFASKCWLVSPEWKFKIVERHFKPEMFTEALNFPNIEIPPEYMKVLSPYYYNKVYARKQLTVEDVKYIKLNHQNLKNVQLAQKFFVTPSTISQIKSGKRWSEVVV